MENVEAVGMSCATLASFKRDLLGTQPAQVQSPPMRSLSSRATLAPSFTAKSAAIRPTEPAPTIARSYLSVFIRHAPAASDLRLGTQWRKISPATATKTVP